MRTYNPWRRISARLKSGCYTSGDRRVFVHAVKPAFVVAVSLIALVLLPVSGKLLANIVPQFQAASDLYISEGQSVSLTVRASDSDGDPLALSMSNRPGGARFTDRGDGSGVFTWAPAFVGPLSSGASPFVVEFVVSDGSAQSSLSLQVFVQNVNRAPVITAPDSIAIEIGELISFQPTVFDPDFETVTWRAIELPAGGIFEADGLSPVNFGWLPKIEDSGFSRVTLVATDALGLADTLSTSLLVTVGAAYVLTITTDTVFPGEFLTLSAGLKNRDPLSAFDIAISFDPSVMAVLSINNSASRTSYFESFTFEFAAPNPGDLRITGLADVNDGLASPPLAPGDGEIFELNLKISSLNGLAGFFLPVKFGMSNPFDTFTVSLSKSDGSKALAAEIELNNGGAKLKDKSDIFIGDINLNGLSFEIADALRFTKFFIDPERFQFSAQQFANSDVNGDGFTASIADLVALLGIIVSGGVPRRVPGGSASAVLFTQQISRQNGRLSTDVYVNSEAELGGALLTFALDSGHPGYSNANDNTPGRVLLSPELADAGILLKSRVTGDTLRVLMYSESSGAIGGGRRLLFSLEYAETSAALLKAELATTQGAVVVTRISDGPRAALPVTFRLNQNYPNPFNPSTKITFALERPSRVSLNIYDILGRAVRELVDEDLSAGEHLVAWNGADESGAAVASGVYVYRLSVDGQAVSRKMTLLK